MSQTYAAKINTEHVGLHFEHEFLSTLRARNLQPEIEELWNVGTDKPGTDDSGYVLAVVSHLPGPLDEIDVAATERRETKICGCPGYYFNCYDSQVGAKIDDCKHCDRVSRKRRTEIDDQQATL